MGIVASSLWWAASGSVVGSPSPEPSPQQVQRAPASREAEALDALARAQQRAASGDLEEAVEILHHAVELDPQLASAYLMRVQVRFEQLGRLQQVPQDPAERRRWIERGEQAVADLGRYIELASLDPEDVALFEARRDEFRAAIEQARQAERQAQASLPIDPHAPLEREPSAEPPRSTSVDEPRWSHPMALSFVTGGALASATSVGLLSATLRVAPQCTEGTSDCWVAEVQRDTRTLGAGLSLAGVGAGLVTAGAVLLARRGDHGAIGRRRRRTVAATMFASAAATLVTSAVLGGLSANRPEDRWSDVEAMAQTQGMANASLAIGALVPTFLGAGIGLSLPPRATERRASLARRW